MTGVRFKAIVPLAASGTADRTMLQLIGATNHRVHIREMLITYAGATSTAVPHRWKILTQTTAGTNSALTLNKTNSGDDESLEVTANYLFTSTDPTDSTVMYEFNVPVYQGGIWVPFDYGDLVIVNGARLGFKVYTPAASINFSLTVIGEE